MAKRKRSWEEDLAEVDQKDNESLNEDNESLDEDIAVDAGEDTGEDEDLTADYEDGSNSISESNCHSERTGQEGEEATDMEEPDNESVDEDIAGEQEEEVIAFPRPDNEQKLLWDTYKVTIGFDGSLVHDGDYVYVLPLGEVMQIDYFHGCNCNGSPVCQMMGEDESDFVASELIALQRGFVANRIINVQRRWRRLRAESLRLLIFTRIAVRILNCLAFR